MRSCPSVRPSVGPSVGPSVRLSRVIFRRVLGASCAVYPALLTDYMDILSEIIATINVPGREKEGCRDEALDPSLRRRRRTAVRRNIRGLGLRKTP